MKTEILIAGVARLGDASREMLDRLALHADAETALEHARPADVSWIAAQLPERPVAVPDTGHVTGLLDSFGLAITTGQGDDAIDDAWAMYAHAKTRMLREVIRRSSWWQNLARRAAADDRLGFREPVSEELLVGYAREDPERLFAMIEGGLDDHHLTYAAEAVGLVRGHDDAAVAVLLRLVGHEAAHVREGALYGLARHIGRDDVREVVRTCMECDVNPGVRAAADDLLEDSG